MTARNSGSARDGRAPEPTAPLCKKTARAFIAGHLRCGASIDDAQELARKHFRHLIIGRGYVAAISREQTKGSNR